MHEHGCNCEGHHEHSEGGCNCGGHHHEEEALVYVFEDENGNEIECEIVDAFEVKESEYAVLENLQDGSRTILKMDGEDADGNPNLCDISDEEFDDAAKFYESLMASEVLTDEE